MFDLEDTLRSEAHRLLTEVDTLIEKGETTLKDRADLPTTGLMIAEQTNGKAQVNRLRDARRALLDVMKMGGE